MIMVTIWTADTEKIQRPPHDVTASVSVSVSSLLLAPLVLTVRVRVAEGLWLSISLFYYSDACRLNVLKSKSSRGGKFFAAVPHVQLCPHHCTTRTYCRPFAFVHFWNLTISLCHSIFKEKEAVCLSVVLSQIENGATLLLHNCPFDIELSIVVVEENETSQNLTEANHSTYSYIPYKHTITKRQCYEANRE